MRKLTAATAFTTILSLSAGAALAEADSCQTVRLANLGWTDILFTDATVELILDTLGYDAGNTILGLGVTYAALQEGNMDAFQGNWRPVQDESFKEYFDKNLVDVLGVNLEGAKFTLAVPAYMNAAGIRSFADVAANRELFDGKIYGIEPGSNDYLLDMVANGLYGFDDSWEVVETSESGMLSQVERAISRQEPVVFLGWEPHPMNINYEIAYLEDGDEVFGANFGGATVRTLSRPGYAAECPNVARLLSQMQYTLAYENYGMNRILSEGLEPMDAARAQLKEMPELLGPWLEGVTTREGAPALPVIRAALGLE
ncbi:glycine betaine ABC transporter substrate-binding protein [Pseudogemmobacter faecipullorum]|uniref:Glycine/betaine ABC transporter substrate-binding protein n=1 Tax=Pseudogemmobacter faecipullorum TaxID=2755041 RepID=A0ABS8CNC1_9RHOB|nr:glycine betaine ABC transporter substrate-binding protein [Pseudogemmobacter faecipullorum]MCB5410330.1 glycine/betaine ABC transporter substrate-binding protein [Pseudogemmobacter faecipullorum]